MFLQEYIKLRTEQLRELTHLELDRNFQYVSNPWNPARSYKEGMVVYFGDTSTGSTGLGWWRANKDSGPSTTFDAGNWEPIGASSISGNILVKDSNNLTETANLLEFSSDFDITFNGVNALVELSGSALGGFWSQTGNTIYYEDNVIIGDDTIIDPTSALTIVGNQLITGDLNVSGFINNINLENFYLDYVAHTHTLLPTSFLNYNAVFPNSNGQLADISITSLTNGDFLQWNSIINRWVNVQSTVGAHNLGFHNDVASSVSSTPTNNQILIYNNSISLWENRTLITNNDTGFTGAPFSHNHDTRYWTKSQLSSNTGSIINWSNIFNVPSFPSGNSEYVLMTSDVNLPDARILTGTSSISITDNGPNNSVEISVIPETTVQLINVASNNVGIGTRPTINFIDSAFITTTVTDNSIDNRIDILIEFNGITVPEELTDLNDVDTTGALNGDVLVYNSLINIWEPVQLAIAPVTSVNSQTGIVNLGIADLTDTSIIPGNFPGPGSGSPFTPSTNILAYDDDISKWVNITASQLLASVSSIFLNDILDVNVATGLADGDILYYDDISSLWLSGAPGDANIYTISDLQSGSLNNLYYTQSELSISGGGSIVHWDNIIGEPSFAPASHTHFLHELVDVIDYSTILPNSGDILTWNSSLQLWEPQFNPSAIFSIISNSTTVGTYVPTSDVILSPNIINSLEIQSDNGIILETDSVNNIIKIGTSIDGTNLIYNTDGSISAITQSVGVTVDGKFISGAQQTINTGEVLDIPLNFEYNLFTFNLDGTAIIDGDLNIIDDSCCGLTVQTTVQTYGRFGITDSDGEYTYYDSMYLAMIAATTGDTVEMFTDYVETNNEVILKDGVNINLNGHTYTLDTASTLNTFTNDGAALTCHMYNGKIVRSGGANSLIDSVVIEAVTSNVAITLNNVDVINNSGGCIYSDSSIFLDGGFRIVSGGASINANNCEIINGFIRSNDGGILASGSVTVIDSTLIADQGITTTTTCEIVNSWILSQAGTAVRGLGVDISGSTIQSSTGLAVRVLNRCRISSSSIRCNTGIGIRLATDNSVNSITNCSIRSFQGAGITIETSNSSSTYISHNFIETINGNGIEAESTSGNISIAKNTITIPVVSTTSSNGIQATQLVGGGSIKVIDNDIDVRISDMNSHAINSASGSLAISYVKNSMKTALGTLIGSNVIQAQINTEDNFGNIEM